MTNAQNRKRWAVEQQKKAYANFAREQAERDRADRVWREWNNMFLGLCALTKTFPKPRA